MIAHVKYFPRYLGTHYFFKKRLAELNLIIYVTVRQLSVADQKNLIKRDLFQVR